MNTTRNILIMSLLCIGTAIAQMPPDYSVKPDGKSVIKILYQNNSQVRPLFSYTAAVLPYQADQRIEDSIPKGSGEKLLVYTVASPQTGLLTIANYGGSIFLVSNDTLTLSIDLSRSQIWQSYQFIGAYALMNQYYFSKGEKLGGIPSYIRGGFANEDISLARFSQKMDSLLAVEQHFLQTYSQQHTLPAWFVQDEKKRILYNDAHMRTNAVGYRKFIKKDMPEDLPDTYFSFVTPTLLNNPSAAHLVDYNRFLKDYFYGLFFQQKQTNIITDFTAKQAAERLTGAAWDVFMAYYLDELLAGLPTEAEKIWSKYQARFTDTKWIDARAAYHTDGHTLKPGQKAPNFALINETDSLSYLNEYRGQVVFLSFWFTSCAPCRQEIPYENELVTYFKDKPVKIVSICVMSSRENWQKVSRSSGLQTVNLFANKAWERTIIERYNVKAYPHYVLIDKKGNVVKNNCSRPSGDARKEIEALLNN